MRIQYALPLLVAVCFSGQAYACIKTEQERKKEEAIFHQYDKNDDGFIDTEEGSAQEKDFIQRLQKSDINKDNKLSYEEFFPMTKCMGHS